MTPADKGPVLVTRPSPDGEALAARLSGLGHAPVLAPLMRVVFKADPPPDDLDGRIAVFTSANGVRAFLHLPPGLRGRVGGHRAFAVGPATAEAATQAGFKEVLTAGGDVADLAAEIVKRTPPGARLIHFTGAHRAGDLAGRLGAAERRLLAWRVYEARAETGLPQAARDFLAGPAGAVVFYSPRTARLFAELMAAAGLADLARAHRALVLSAAVGEAAAALPWGRIDCAETPRSEALLRLL